MIGWVTMNHPQTTLKGGGKRDPIYPHWDALHPQTTYAAHMRLKLCLGAIYVHHGCAVSHCSASRVPSAWFSVINHRDYNLPWSLLGEDTGDCNLDGYLTVFHRSWTPSMPCLHTLAPHTLGVLGGAYGALERSTSPRLERVSSQTRHKYCPSPVLFANWLNS